MSAGPTRFFGTAALLAVFLHSAHGWGQSERTDAGGPGADVTPTPVSVVAVDCPEIGEEPRAAFEARAKAELLVRQLQGTLVVHCGLGRARMSWHPIGAPGAETDVVLTESSGGAIERLLEALDRLLVIPPPAAAERVPRVRPEQPPAPPPKDSTPVPVEAPAGHAGLEIGAGALGELWSSAVLGAAGPGVVLGVVLPSDFVIGARAEYLWGLKSVEGTSARQARLEAVAAYRFGVESRFEIGASLLADAAHASSSPDVAPADHWAFGGTLAASYALVVEPVRATAGPFLVFHPGGVRFELGNTELFRIPALTVGLRIEGSVRLF